MAGKLLTAIQKHWPQLVAITAAQLIVLWIVGCPPRVTSLNSDHKLVTRVELQLELDTIIAEAEIRLLDLDKQDRLRQIILQNAVLLVQGTPLSPVGIIAGIAALYGIGTAVKDTGSIIKKRKTKILGPP